MLNIGLAIGHDASIAVVDSNLNLIYAASEERFSRKKGHLGSPFLAFNEMVSALGLNDKILQKSNIFIGSCYSEKIDWVSYLFLSKNFQNNIDLFNIGTPPGALKKLKTLATNCTNNFTSQLSHLFNFDESNI